MTVGILTTLGLLALAPRVGEPAVPGRVQSDTLMAPGATHLVVVVGIGGSPEYTGRFNQLALSLIRAATEQHGVAPDHVHYLGERTELAPEVMEARSTIENLGAVFSRLATQLRRGDGVLVVLIGHGSWDEQEARFNLPGPDLSPAELSLHLASLGTSHVALVNCASSSGAFLQPLSEPGRIVLTATRSGRERNETVFADYFVEAFAGDGSDLDKDGRVSLLEAFEYARRATADHYERGEHMLTEHALLEDNGDGEGSLEPDPEVGDGAVARAFFLAPATLTLEEAARAADDPELARLYRERSVWEERIQAHRARRAEMDPEAYTAELERLLLELARVSQEIRRRGGGGA